MKISMDIESLNNECNKVVYESYSDFEKSIFSSVYKTAAKQTAAIIDEHNKLYNSERRYNSFKNNSSIYNIIPFIGGRGVGKTSAMLSFARFLGNNSEIKYSDNIYAKVCNENNYFITIDCIDASLLEEGEGILEIVLAEMLAKYKQESNITNISIHARDYEYKKRELQKCFNDIYDCLLNKYRKDSRMRDDSAVSIDILNQLAVSSNLKGAFEVLVKNYFAAKSSADTTRSCSENNYFLVIPIDDLDMNLSHAYDMMEEIRRYLMVPNVIILMALKDTLLSDIFYNHFSEILKSIKNDSKQQFEIDYRKLAWEYMDKALPVNNKIFMPDIKRDGVDLRIDENSIKYVDLLKLIIYNSTGIIFDYNNQGGILSADSLRSLMQQHRNFVTNLYPEQNIDIEHHIEWLMDDLNNRLSKQMLSEFQSQIFKQICQGDIGSVNRSIYSYCIKLEIIPKTDHANIIGGILEMLNEITEKFPENRPLAECILLYTTICIKLGYYSEPIDYDCFFGWNNSFIPATYIRRIKTSIGSSNRPLSYTMTMPNYMTPNENISDEEIMILAKQILEDNKNNIEASIIIYFMLSKDPRYILQYSNQKEIKELTDKKAEDKKDEDEKTEDKKIEDSTGTVNVRILNAAFSVTAIMNNSKKYGNILSHASKMWMEILMKYYQLSNIDIVSECICQFFKGYTVQFEKWKNKYNDIFNSSDLMFAYNMGKRLIVDSRLTNDNVSASIEDFYKRIQSELNKLDVFYNDNASAIKNNQLRPLNEIKVRMRFSDAFKECPYIKMFSDHYNNSEIEKILEDIVTSFAAPENNLADQNG